MFLKKNYTYTPPSPFLNQVFKRNSSAPIALPKRGDVRGAVSSQLKPAVLCVTQKRVPGEKNDSAATAQWAPEACLYYLRANGASDSEPFRVHKSWPVRSLVRMEVTKLASADPAPFFLELTFQGADKEGGDSSTLFASANESVQTNIACFLHFYCQEYEKRPVPIFGMETEAQEAWLTENRCDLCLDFFNFVLENEDFLFRPKTCRWPC